MNSGQGSGAAAHVILHIGAGSFHRAHQAWYLHRLNEAKVPGEPHWSLTVGNIHTRINPAWDLPTVLRFMTVNLQYSGLFSIEAYGHDAVRNIYNVILDTI